MRSFPMTSLTINQIFLFNKQLSSQNKATQQYSFQGKHHFEHHLEIWFPNSKSPSKEKIL